jgi:uncharacterized metal-binding protein
VEASGKSTARIDITFPCSGNRTASVTAQLTASLALRLICAGEGCRQLQTRTVRRQAVHILGGRLMSATFLQQSTSINAPRPST